FDLPADDAGRVRRPQGGRRRLSLDLHRRHLTEDPRRAIAAEVAIRLEKEESPGVINPGRTVEDLPTRWRGAGHSAAPARCRCRPPEAADEMVLRTPLNVRKEGGLSLGEGEAVAPLYGSSGARFDNKLTCFAI